MGASSKSICFMTEASAGEYPIIKPQITNNNIILIIIFHVSLGAGNSRSGRPPYIHQPFLLERERPVGPPGPGRQSSQPHRPHPLTCHKLLPVVPAHPPNGE